ELLHPDVTLVCSVGRQIPRKGFDWFVRTVLPLLPEDIHYWLAGDGPQAAAIRAAAEEAGVAHRVRLLGTVDEEDLMTLLHAADLFAMPNRPTRNDPEGFGVVMLEAGLCGTPTVAASLEGIRDVVADGWNGHLVPSGAALAFAETILRYHEDGAALAAFARRTVHYTVDTFNWASVAATYVRTLYAHALPEAAEEHAAALEAVPVRPFRTAYPPVPVWVPAPVNHG
ncbi:MAG: glycosyltransferase family 4 protein, partial [Rhodothermales bacterium]|nr:glycosyltransferase family 4 protein [Rhodothermales bacterium]